MHKVVRSLAVAIFLMAYFAISADHAQAAEPVSTDRLPFQISQDWLQERDMLDECDLVRLQTATQDRARRELRELTWRAKALPNSFYFALAKSKADFLANLSSDSAADASRAIAINPTSADAYCQRALAYWDCARPELSIDDCSKVLKLEPKNGRAHALMSISEKNRRAARSMALKAVHEAPNDWLSLFALAATESDLKHYTHAVELYNRSLCLKPGSAATYYYLALAYSHSGQKTRCLEAFHKAILLSPDYAAAIRDYSNTLFDDQPKRSVEMLRAALSRAHEDQDKHWLAALLTKDEASLGMHEDAVVHATIAIRTANKPDADLLEERAFERMTLGFFAGALRDREQSCSIRNKKWSANPTKRNWTAYVNSADWLIYDANRMHQTSKAIQTARDVLRSSRSAYESDEAYATLGLEFARLLRDEGIHDEAVKTVLQCKRVFEQRIKAKKDLVAAYIGLSIAGQYLGHKKAAVANAMQFRQHHLQLDEHRYKAKINRAPEFADAPLPVYEFQKQKFSDRCEFVRQINKAMQLVPPCYLEMIRDAGFSIYIFGSANDWPYEHSKDSDLVLAQTYYGDRVILLAERNLQGNTTNQITNTVHELGHALDVSMDRVQTQKAWLEAFDRDQRKLNPLLVRRESHFFGAATGAPELFALLFQTRYSGPHERFYFARDWRDELSNKCNTSERSIFWSSEPRDRGRWVDPNLSRSDSFADLNIDQGRNDILVSAYQDTNISASDPGDAFTGAKTSHEETRIQTHARYSAGRAHIGPDQSATGARVAALLSKPFGAPKAKSASTSNLPMNHREIVYPDALVAASFPKLFELFNRLVTEKPIRPQTLPPAP